MKDYITRLSIIESDVTSAIEAAFKRRDEAVDTVLDLIAKSGEVSVIGIRASTPGFNDGEPCENMTTVYIGLKDMVDEEVLSFFGDDLPDFVDEVPAGIHFFIGETDILSWGRAIRQEPAQSVCTVLVDDIHWVNPVAQGLGHLAAVFSPDQAMHQDILKWLTACEFQGLENHPRHPEKDDVVASNQG